MLAIEESLVQTAELPYRVVNTRPAISRRGGGEAYDIEAWFPSQERYREITSMLEHDRLPGAAQRHPLPPGRAASSRTR